MRPIFAALSVLILIASTLPYALDILKGKVKPARATRWMFFVLMFVAFIQQRQLGSGWANSVTFGEFMSALCLVWLAQKYGVGGLRKLDIICYVLLGVSIIVWLSTPYTLLALTIAIFTDAVSFTPTIVKTWHHPKSETPLYYWAGVVAPLFSIMAEQHRSASFVAFPLYLVVANGLEIALIHNLLQYS